MQIQPDSHSSSKRGGSLGCNANCQNGNGNVRKPISHLTYADAPTERVLIPRTKNVGHETTCFPPDEAWENELFETWGVVFRANPDRCRTCGSLSRYTNVRNICLECLNAHGTAMAASEAERKNGPAFTPGSIERYTCVNDDFFEPQETIDEAEDTIRLRTGSVIRVSERYMVHGTDESDPTEEKRVRELMRQDGVKGAQEDEFYP